MDNPQNNWYESFWRDTKILIANAWPELAPGSLFAPIALERRNMLNLLDKQAPNAKADGRPQLTPPWVVVDFRARPSAEWSGITQAAYEVETTVYYVVVDDGTNTIAHLWERLQTLNEQFQQTAVSFTVLVNVQIAVDVDSPINSAMLNAEAPITAGSLTFTAVTGYGL